MKQDVRPARQAANSLVPTIFHELWWLNIATGGKFDIVEVAQDGKTVGWLPYFLQNRFGLKYSVLPGMVHSLGPAIHIADGSPETRRHKTGKITRELIGALPPAAIYKYKCHGEITDVVAFQQEKFLTGVQFTFEVAPLPAEILWNNLSKSKRSEIRRAQKALVATTIDDPEEFWRFYANNIEQRGMKNAYHGAATRRVIVECLVRGCGKIYAAKDADGSLAAAVFCIWDQASAYYYMTTRTVRAHDGAVSLLIWEAIQDAAQRGLIFDFDGLSSNEGVSFYAGFGGLLRPRYIVTRATLIGRVAWDLKESFRDNRYFC